MERCVAEGQRRFVNETNLKPEKVMDLWINGWYFHNDDEKRRKLEALADVPASRWLFIDSVVSASMVVLYTGHVLKIALRDGLVSEPPVRERASDPGTRLPRPQAETSGTAGRGARRAFLTLTRCLDEFRPR